MIRDYKVAIHIPLAFSTCCPELVTKWKSGPSDRSTWLPRPALIGPFSETFDVSTLNHPTCSHNILEPRSHLYRSVGSIVLSCRRVLSSDTALFTGGVITPVTASIPSILLSHAMCRIPSEILSVATGSHALGVLPNLP